MRVQLVSGVVFTIATAIGNADAGYLIQLRNGNDYVTARYWREGNQVLFDTYGGVFGIDKSFIAQITKTEEVSRLASVSDREPGNTSVPGLKDKKEIDANSKEETISSKKGDGNDAIRGEFTRLKEKVNEVDGMLTGEIRELLNQITTFKNTISKNSTLFFEYAREFNDAHELGNIVETALRRRTQ